MKKVLIITYYWPPSGGAGVQRWLKFIKYFTRLGIQPYVITVDPTMATYPVIDQTLNKDIPKDIFIYHTKTSEPYSFYKKLKSNKEVPYAGFANEGNPGFVQKLSRFIRGNFFIPDARKGWNSYAIEKAKEIILKENIQTVITTSPPHSTQLIGLELKKEFNINWIADIRDPWTDIYYYDTMLHTSWAKKKDLFLEKKVIDSADKIVVVSNSIKELFNQKSDLIHPDKIHIIPNGYDEDDFINVKAKNTGKVTLAYTGTITKDYPTYSLAKALKKSSINIQFTGKADNTTKQNFNELATFTNHVTHNESIQLLVNASALLLIIPKIKNNKGILTGKLFEYIGANKPILCIGPTDGDAAKIIDTSKAGKTYDYDDLNGISKFIKQLKNGDKLHDNNNEKVYSRKNLTSLYLEII